MPPGKNNEAPALRAVFSDSERAALRRQLAGYAESEGIGSARVLLQRIEGTLGRELGCDDRRLRRFLNDTHRTSDDVVEHLVRFLNIAQAPYARLAEEMARYFSRADEDGRVHAPHTEKMRTLTAGTYHVYLQGTRSDVAADHTAPSKIGTVEEELARIAPRFDIPYSVLKLDTVPGAPYLSAYEEVGNPDREPFAPFATEEHAFGTALVRFIGCLVVQQLGASYVIVLRRLWEFSDPKLYIIGETYPEDPSTLALTGALIERNRNIMSEIHGAAATVKLVRQSD